MPRRRQVEVQQTVALHLPPPPACPVCATNVDVGWEGGLVVSVCWALFFLAFVRSFSVDDNSQSSV